MSVNSPVLPLDGNAREVLQGLTSRPKMLPPKLFYDARGSDLFEQITELPEYYLTSTEQGIFERHALDMVAAAGEASTIIELGAGTARKTMLVLRAALDREHSVTFIPVDVSSSALEVACIRVRSELPSVAVHPLVMDFTHRLSAFGRFPGRKLVLYIGSSIGNMEPMAAAAFLRRLRRSLTRGDSLLLGTDMQKPVEILLPAYDDAAGVTALFNLNVLERINREFDANFDTTKFLHRAIWNERESRIEMHLESREEHRVRVNALEFSTHFEQGETIHTENSYKFSPSMIASIANLSGFHIEQSWSDERNWFTVSLLRA